MNKTYGLLNILVRKRRWEHCLNVDGLGNRDYFRAVDHGVLVATEEGDLQPGIDEAIMKLLGIV